MKPLAFIFEQPSYYKWYTLETNEIHVYDISDEKMSSGRGDLPHPLNIMYPNSKRNEIFPHFLIYHVKSIFIIIFKHKLIVCLSYFTFVTNQRKNIPPEMKIQECVYYTIFRVHSLLQFIVSVTHTKFLYMDMTIALNH